MKCLGWVSIRLVFASITLLAPIAFYLTHWIHNRSLPPFTVCVSCIYLYLLFGNDWFSYIGYSCFVNSLFYRLVFLLRDWCAGKSSNFCLLYFPCCCRRAVNKGIGVDNMHYLNDGLWKVISLSLSLSLSDDYINKWK